MSSQLPDLPFPIDKRLVALDVETTSLNPTEARVVEISIFKYEPNGKREEFYSLINPECQIPEDSIKVHGITNDKVKEAPVFPRLASHLLTFIGLPDFIGYSILYDLQVLKAEFGRINMLFEWPSARILDGYRMWQVLEPRSLTDAVERFLGGEHIGAHGAEADNLAALQVVLSMLSTPVFSTNFDEIHRQCFPRLANAIDSSGKLIMKDGHIVINFGKNVGRKLSQVDPGYLEWMLKTDFPPDVKAPIRDFLAQRR